VALPCDQELLAPLQGLSRLDTLLLYAPLDRWKGLEAMCHLTGLQMLRLNAPKATKPGLLELTQLKQLTRLEYNSKDDHADITQV
jgi:hypothetical protein